LPIITGGRSFAEYWKYFVARFNDVHAFANNFAGSERIWMKFGGLRIYCLQLALTDTKSQNMSRTSHSDLVTHQSIHITQREFRMLWWSNGNERAMLNYRRQPITVLLIMVGRRHRPRVAVASHSQSHLMLWSETLGGRIITVNPGRCASGASRPCTV